MTPIFSAFFGTFFIILLSFNASMGVITRKSHSWPHYAEDGGEEICTCNHMEAIIEYFKDKDNLTMGLGAGSEEREYTDRFKDYTFVVSNEFTEPLKKRLLRSLLTSMQDLQNKLKNGQKEPIPIPLNFNSIYFFNFLDKLSGKFKEIIFDCSVTKFVFGLEGPYGAMRSWGLWQVDKIFNALTDGGVFYSDTSFSVSVPLRVTRRNQPGPLYLDREDVDASIENNEVKYKPHFGNIDDYPNSARINASVALLRKVRQYHNQEDEKNLKFHAPFSISPVQGIVLTIRGGKDLSAGKYISKIEDPDDGVFVIPSHEYIVEHIIAFLKLVGFEAEYKQDAPYPLECPWFEKYNYIYAKKPEATKAEPENK